MADLLLKEYFRRHKVAAGQALEKDDAEMVNCGRAGVVIASVSVI